MEIACHEMHSRGLPDYNMNPLIKYYMYGDIYSVSFLNFEPCIFLLKHKTAFITKQSALLGWLTLGKRGDVQNIHNIVFDHIWDMGLQLGLVDIDYLYSEILSSGFKVEKECVRDFYKVIGSPLLMPLSKNFRPKDIPILVKFSTEKKRFNPLQDYICNFYLVHIYLAQNVISNIQAQDCEGAFNTLRILEDSFGNCYRTAQAYACLSYMQGDINSAEEHYKIYSWLKPTKNDKSLLPGSFLRGEAKTIAIKLDHLFGLS